MSKKIVWDDNFFDVLSRGYLGKKTSENHIFTITKVDDKLNLTAYFLDGIHNPVTLWHPSFTSVENVKLHAIKVMKLYSDRYRDEETIPIKEKVHNNINVVVVTIMAAIFVGLVMVIIASHDKTPEDPATPVGYCKIYGNQLSCTRDMGGEPHHYKTETYDVIKR